MSGWAGAAREGAAPGGGWVGPASVKAGPHGARASLRALPLPGCGVGRWNAVGREAACAGGLGVTSGVVVASELGMSRVLWNPSGSKWKGRLCHLLQSLRLMIILKIMFFN